MEARTPLHNDWNSPLCGSAAQLKLLQEQGKSAILSLSTDVVRTIVTQDDEALQLFATLSTVRLLAHYGMKRIRVAQL